MTLPFFVTEFILAIEKSLQDNSFAKISLGSYSGDEPGMRNIHIRKIKVKRQDKLSFTYRFKTRDIVKNYDFPDAFAMIEDALCDGFHSATLFTTQFDLVLEKKTLKTKAATVKEAPPSDHDRQKNRLISSEGKQYLYDLKITDDKGQVYKNAQDKFRQINKYIEILSGLIKNISPDQIKKIVDMGSGKGYLTFALYDYLLSQNINADVVGVEYRQDMVDLCNGIADKNDFIYLSFSQGTINDYDCSGANILIALHACDTATDDAIAKGLEADAELIVVAPCCHKQIRREIEQNKASNDLDFLLKYGTFLERQAEMVTDGLRAMILEYCGYSTKVFEFISDAHTPKNVLIVAARTNKEKHDPQILEKIKAAKTYFGIGHHHLEKVL
ncbi:MAG: methyltransferase [Alphaproteobacteria bacterium CG1_02_46_17]|nr:MAG: methyltransferase [Alphaproteobacteria bacterium CG1_02_46_17]